MEENAMNENQTSRSQSKTNRSAESGKTNSTRSPRTAPTDSRGCGRTEN